MPAIACIDGNEAAARIAHRLSEVIAIYPITPASPMGELADAWSAQGRTNLWGTVPEVIEMQSEAGAAGVLHGAVQRGALATTLHRVAGPAADAAEHVQDRGRADAARDPRRGARDRDPRALDLRRPQRRDGGARAPASRCCVRESCRRRTTSRSSRTPRRCATRVPFLHFFDGFRTSHEVDQDRAARRRRPAALDRRGRDPRAPRAPPHARRAGAARHRRRTPTCSSRRARRAIRSTPRCPAIVAALLRRARRAHRPALRARRLRRARPTPSA